MRALLLATLILFAIQQSATGRVEILVRDRNTYEGIPGVPVSLTFQVPNQPPRPASTIFTDSRGLAVFPALSVGGYTISIGQIYQGQVGSVPPYVPVDAGMSRYLEISVSRVATVTARIVDQNDAPRVGAVVTLLSTVYVDGRQALRFMGNNPTDAEGKFRLIGVPYGEHYLRIENQSQWRVAYYPGVNDPSAAQRVIVRDQDVSLGDIKLPRTPQFKVSGTVIHSAADARSALTVYLAHDSPILQEDPFRASASSLRVSPNEVQFEINDIPAGSYIIYAVLGDRLSGFLGRENLRIEDHDVAELKIAVKPMVGIAGKIVMKDAQYKVFENLRITTPSKESFPPLPFSNLSREAIAVSRSGEFAVRNLVDGGRYGISVEGLPDDAYVSDIRLGIGSILPDGSFVANLTQESFEVQIAKPAAIIRGSVRNSAGQSAAGAFVLAVPDFARRRNLAFYKGITTDFTGQFAIRGLAPGEYQLFAWPVLPARDVTDDPAFLAPFESRSTTVRVNPGITTDTTLRLIQ